MATLNESPEVNGSEWLYLDQNAVIQSTALYLSDFSQENNATLFAISGMLSIQIDANSSLDISTITKQRLEGEYMVLEWYNKDWAPTTISLNLKEYFDTGIFQYEEISFGETQAKYLESISSFREGIIELQVLSESINESLVANNDEFWEVINEDDVIQEWPFAWKTLVEAVLIYRSKVLSSSTALRNLGAINTDEYPEIIEARIGLYDAGEEYLLLSMGIWETREELTHVIPKTIGESQSLIGNAIERRNPREILDWMRDIHNQIDANNWQDGTVVKNYGFFIETLNERALFKINNVVSSDTSSPFYGDISLLLEFAVLTSGRVAWDNESFPLMEDWLWIFAEQSPVDSRLWRREIAEQAIIYAMDIPRETQDGESRSMIETIMPHIDMSEPLLDGKSPGVVINNSKTAIEESLIDLELSATDLEALFDGLWYQNIITRAESGDLAPNYNSLSLEDMIAVSWLARIYEELRETRTTTTWARGLMTEIVYTGENKKTNYEQFTEIARNAAEGSVKHIWDELDKNFDDSWSQQWINGNMRDADGDGSTTNEINEARAVRFGITDIHSPEYQLFSLYNDINGNGDFWELSDSTVGAMKTAGFMIAMIAGSIILWWAVIIPALARGWIVITSMAGKWAIMWASWSALGYGLDSVIWDAPWFYSPNEAFTWLVSDFAIGAWTWALSWPLAKFMPEWTPESATFVTDLAVLWLPPEFARMYAVNRVWHGSDIFTQNEDPIVGEIYDVQMSLLQHEASDEQIELFLNNPESPELSPHLQNYSFFTEVFHGVGLENHENITPEFNANFQKAYAIWKVLSPWSGLNIWQSEPEFEWIMHLQEDGLEWMHSRILLATNAWITRQESRLSDMQV